MSRCFTIAVIAVNDIAITCDRDTARLIADALDIVRPDHTFESELATDFAFTIRSLLDRLPPPITGNDR